MTILEQFDFLLPLASSWAEEQESMILRDGIALTEPQMVDAHTLGVGQPEEVRLLKVDAIPLSKDPFLQKAAQDTRLLSPLTTGLTLRYGIFIRSDCWGGRGLIAHELVHTTQYEKLGGITPFLKQYLYECITIGYPEAPMEQEAIKESSKLIEKPCGS